MDEVWRAKTLGAAAIAATLIGAALVYFGVGAGRYPGIGWFEYIREMMAIVDAVSVEPAGISGLILAGSGALAAVFLGGHRWSAPRDDDADRGRRSRILTRVWWGAAALTGTGLLIAYISISAPQPFFSYGDASEPGPVPDFPSVLEDPTLLFNSIHVASATFVGAAVMWAGLLVMCFLLGRDGVPGRASTSFLNVARRGAWIWWGGVAFTTVGLAVVVGSYVSTPPPLSYDDLMPASLPSNVIIALGVEDAGVEGWAAAIFVGTALTLLGMLVMSVVVGHSRVTRRAQVTA